MTSSNLISFSTPIMCYRTLCKIFVVYFLLEKKNKRSSEGKKTRRCGGCRLIRTNDYFLHVIKFGKLQIFSLFRNTIMIHKNPSHSFKLHRDKFSRYKISNGLFFNIVKHFTLWSRWNMISARSFSWYFFFNDQFLRLNDKSAFQRF